MMRVKICGITNEGDAGAAVELGVDAIGFIFAPSPRAISPERALTVIRSLPPLVQSVGVFVNETPGYIKRIADFCGLDMVQLHGDESPAICSECMPRTIKSLSLKDESSLARLRPYQGKVRAFLFDTYSEEKRGGTGRTFDWGLALRGKEMGVPVILSGGLNPQNVMEAISRVKPFAVDVNSGVEERPGKKSHRLMGELMAAIRSLGEDRRPPSSISKSGAA
jgi:phosphoribosylanthranilate isomerase